MGETLSFQRARKPEEQLQRRQAILAAATELFDAEGAQGAGLNAIAAKAGFAKSNVYRYYESREAVLIDLFRREFEGFVADFESRLAGLEPGDIRGIAQMATQGFATRPRFSNLLSILSGVLEQNVSEAEIISLKRGVVALYLRVAAAIHSRLPGTSLEDCAWVGATGATLVAGMWPSVMGSSAAEKVLAMPEFAHLKPNPERDLPRAIEALLRSIL